MSKYRTGRCIGLTTGPTVTRCPNPSPEGDETLCPAHQGMREGKANNLRTVEDFPSTLMAWFAYESGRHRGQCRAVTSDGERCSGWTVPFEPFCRKPHTKDDDIHAVPPEDDQELDQLAIRSALAPLSDYYSAVKFVGTRIQFGDAASEQTGLGAFTGGVAETGGND